MLSIAGIGTVPNVPVVPRILFSSLVDDAAVFPPRGARLASAVAEHLVWHRTSRRDLIGSFVCPASRLEKLAEAMPVDDHVSLSVVLDGDLALLQETVQLIAEDQRLVLAAVEASYERLGDEAVHVGMLLDHMPDVQGVLEVPRHRYEESWTLIEPGLWNMAKYRTGGVTPDAFPTEAELAEFLVLCVQTGLPFKLTAGLHHAVRNYDARQGFQQHGVLNVLVATEAALAEETPEDVAAVLGERDPDVLLGRVKHWDTERCAVVRTAFRSFGCCSPAEPLSELTSLGLLQEWL